MKALPPKEKFLTDHEIELLSEEQVLHYGSFSKENIVIDFLHYTSIILVVLLTIMAAMGFIFLFIPIIAGFIVIPFFARNQGKDFQLVTSKGLRLKQGLIYWNAVQEIKTINKGNNRKLVFQVLDSFTSESEVDSIFLQGQYNAAQLYTEILPYWETNAPKKQLNELKERIAKSYNLTTEVTTKGDFKLVGKHRELDVVIHFNSSFPFQYVTVLVKLPWEIETFFQVINQKQDFDKNEFKTGIPFIDNNHYIKGNIEELNHLFTKDITSTLQYLQELGTANCTFGKPLRFKSKNPKSTIKQQEDVLDSMLISSDLEKSQRSWKGKPENTLRFKGILLPEFKNNPQKAVAFVESGINLSVQFAEGLKRSNIN